MTALEIMTGYDMFKERFLRLPRELRDLVSANVHRNSAPVFLERIDADPAILVLFETEGSAVSPEYRAEVLEAFYTHSTFNFTFPASGYTSSEAYQVQWGPHPQFVKYIRRLYVHADELDPALYLQHVRYDRLDTLRFRTKIWERLLELPRLEQLTIRMQKRHACYFSWADFGPILVHLRENMPRLQTTFSISFDAMFERFGRDPIWEVYTEPWVPEEEPYDPKGFLDVSELIKAPTQEDFRYVQENCAGQKETLARISWHIDLIITQSTEESSRWIWLLKSQH